MSEANKAQFYNVIIGVLVAMCLGISGWTVQTLVADGQLLATHTTQININTVKLKEMDAGGSAALREHIMADNQRVVDLADRVNKMDTLILAVSASLARIDTMGARLDALRDGQTKLEQMLSRHLNNEEKDR